MPFGAFCPLPERLGGDALTGRAATQHARHCADLVAVKRTGPLAWFTWSEVGVASTPATITAYSGMNGVGPGFAPSSAIGIPGVARLVFTWARVAEDDYQVAAPFMPRLAAMSFAGISYRRSTYVLRTNSIEIYAWDAAGTVVNPQPGGTCALW